MTRKYTAAICQKYVKAGFAMILETKEYHPDDIGKMIADITQTYRLSEQELIQLLAIGKEEYRQFLNGTFRSDCYMKLLLLHRSCTVSPAEKLKALTLQIKTEMLLPDDVIAKLAGIQETALLRFLEDPKDISASDQCRLFAAVNTLLSIRSSGSPENYPEG